MSLSFRQSSDFWGRQISPEDANIGPRMYQGENRGGQSRWGSKVVYFALITRTF